MFSELESRDIITTEMLMVVPQVDVTKAFGEVKHDAVFKALQSNWVVLQIIAVRAQMWLHAVNFTSLEHIEH